MMSEDVSKTVINAIEPGIHGHSFFYTTGCYRVVMNTLGHSVRWLGIMCCVQ
jgi:hypothetical protein